MEADTNELCCGCLSNDRKMKSVRDYWTDHGFFQILTEISEQISDEYSLCWECKTRISNFVIFRDQMRQSCKILQEYIKENHQTWPQSESSLKVCTQRGIEINPIDILNTSEKDNFTLPFYDVNDHQIKEELSVTHNISKENVSQLQVKDEMEVYSDDDKYLIEIRKDRTKEISSKNKNSTKKEEGKASKSKKRKKPRLDFEKIILSAEEVIKERALMELREEYINAMFKCEKCVVTFTNEDDLTEHALTKHLMHASKHICDVCQRSFRTEYSLTVHSRRHSVRYRCAACAHCSATERAAWRHHRDTHTESENNDIAAKAFQSYEDKKLQDVKPNNPKSEAQIPCEYCDKTFRWKTSLRKHMERHRIEAGHKRRPYCEPCRMPFTTTSNLRKHVKTSSKHQIQLKLRKLKKDFPEDATDQTQQAKDFEMIKSKINSQREQFPCPQCEKKFQWKGNLLRHLHSHAARANGDLVCAPCNRTFSSIATYKQHMKISRKHVSENEFKYMCSDCGKRFANKIKLRDHIDWEHLKNYTHTCGECQKVFKSHTSLYLHRQVVHKLYNAEHLCDHCGKSFPNKTKLSSHITGLHSRASPYKCATCAAKFSWHSCLSRHVRRVHRTKQAFTAPT